MFLLEYSFTLLITHIKNMQSINLFINNTFIFQHSQNDKNKEKELKATITNLLNEIGLSRSLPVIRWAGIILNNILDKICTGVYVNEESIKHLKGVIGNQPVLYLPSHRSYADFVLMSYICFAYDLEIPGIAAGMGIEIETKRHFF